MTTEIQVPKAVSMSMDIEAADKEKLQSVFPGCFTEGKLDIDKLLSLCGEYIDNDFEKYKFEWKGKSECYRIAGKRSTGTLRPAPAESVNFEDTNNLYIEGDNLEVLKLLQTAYYRKVKMIYIDPPYNTGNDFVYEDDFKDPMAKYKEITSQTTKSNPETMGRYHTNWLNMMYPRLRLAANLLRDDGVIAVNMDENELINLSRLMDEVFGEENNLGIVVWDKRNPKGDAKGIAYQHEYIIFYAKNRDALTSTNEIKRPKKNATKILDMAEKYFSKISNNYTLEMANKDFSIWINAQSELSGGEKAYNKMDDKGDVYRAVSMAWPNKKEAPKEYFIPLVHPITKKSCPIPERGWRNPPTTMQDLLSKDLILFGVNETTQPTRKYLLRENMLENLPSLLYYGGSDTELLSAMNIPFDTPKAVNVVKEHVATFSKTDDIILDFFSGSATTAHAVMQLNAEDGGNRQFIMVQLPEVCDESSEAAKAGYKNICDIGKERIRRAGKKILETLSPSPLRGEGQGEGEKELAKMDLLNFAKDMRHNPTDTEKKLWYALNNQQLGCKFRRQHQIGNYIVDFVCLDKKLIIECDGGQHTENVDAKRTEFLDQEGFRVLRFWNNEVLKNLDGVLMRIKEVVDNNTLTPTLSPQGRGSTVDVMPLAQGRGNIPDVGFKVFKLDTSNLVKWDDTPLDSTQTYDLFNRLDGMEKSLKKDRTELDVVYEVMAKLGIPLTYKISELNINNRKVYSIGDDGLILVCLDGSNDGITPEDISAMCELAPAKIIAAEEAFKDDVSLSNAYYISKDSGVAIELL